MCKVLLSLIIPVYNQELYIERCLSAIELQKSNKIEVIIIDDGSSDQSKNIISEYCYRNNNFYYFYQKNSGVSSARNFGLQKAQGTYVSFIDPDDKIRDDYVEKVLEVIQNKSIEMLCFNAKRVKFDGTKSNILTLNNARIKVYPHDGINGYLLGYLYDLIEAYVWNKIYNMNVIRKYHITFDCNQKICEDLLFNAEYIEHINEIETVNFSLYEYYIYKNSAIHGYKPYSVYQYIRFIDAFNHIAYKNNYVIPAHNLMSFYIGWWFSVIYDESFSKNYKLGWVKITKFLKEPYYVENFKNIKFFDLNMKQKIYYLFIKLHLSKMVYSILYVYNSILKK